MRWSRALAGVAACLAVAVPAVSVAVPMGLGARAAAAAGLEQPARSPRWPALLSVHGAFALRLRAPAVAPSTNGLPVPLTITASTPPLAKLVGQLVIGSYAGTAPPASLLSAVRAGRLGAVILMGVNTTGGIRSVHAATEALQSAARAGGNPGLLIMTDQEGGEVKRLPGPPKYAAAQMASPSLAHQQGVYTARLLKRAGVNMDLAPVADVVRRDGFIEQEQRSFGRRPATVAAAACAFAAGLAGQGVAYTLKHFPGLGDAIANTDLQPVNIGESATELAADGAAYRRCGRARLAAVMVSSASYRHLTGQTPAVLSQKIYRQVLPGDRVTALPISDSFESGAIEHLNAPARRAINAGLDMVMYPDSESVALYSYSRLLADARQGTLQLPRIRAAYARVIKLKLALGLD